ncbi:MAG: DUF115 domain-containing protein, partial [Paracoccaceae bacterium]|nr:DUF115 domain-containing protein [Paracoccaceae bacterium]
MNIHVSNNKPPKVAKPNSFVEATVSLADCYQNALAEGAKGNDDLTRFWVDSSRSVKAFYKRYQEEDHKNHLLSGLQKNDSKEILIEAVKNIRQAEPFVMAWATKFRALQIRDFEDFHEFHWDIFVDEVVPLTWDWESDLFVIQHKRLAILETLLKRGQQRIILIEPDKRRYKKLCKHVETLKNSDNVAVVKSKDEIKKIISVWIDHPPFFSRVISDSVMPTAEEKKKELEEIQDLAREGMINAITFDNTIKSHGSTWVENGLNNFENLLNHPNMACLKEKFNQASLIVVSPGPSLEKNVHLIEKAKGKAIIMAVSHSLEYLRARNIVPD